MLPDYPYKESVSEVIPNTKRGDMICKMLYKVEGEIEITKCHTDDLVPYQQAFNHPVNRPHNLEQFKKDYIDMDFQSVLKKYFGYNVSGYIKYTFLRILGESGIITLTKNILNK